MIGSGKGSREWPDPEPLDLSQILRGHASGKAIFNAFAAATMVGLPGMFALGLYLKLVAVAWKPVILVAALVVAAILAPIAAYLITDFWPVPKKVKLPGGKASFTAGFPAKIHEVIVTSLREGRLRIQFIMTVWQRGLKKVDILPYFEIDLTTGRIVCTEEIDIERGQRVEPGRYQLVPV